MNQLNYIKIFVEVAEAGSIVRVAEARGVSSAAISKQIASLENKIKLPLFHRTNRRMNLTQFGEIYLEKCRVILLQLKEMDLILIKTKKKPEGILRIASGRYFAEKFIIPRIPGFLEKFPRLTLDMQLSEFVSNPKIDDIDVVFSSDKKMSGDLICKKVIETYHIVCGSPGYFEQYGIPKKPEDLYDHRYITHSFRDRDNVLTFSDKKQLVLKPVLRLNDAGSMLNAAISGAGIISLNHYIVKEAIEKKSLVEVLKKYSNTPRSIYLFYQKSRFIEPNIRVFIDFFFS